MAGPRLTPGAVVSDQRDTFDEVAAEYDAVRPLYPIELFDDLAVVAGGPGQPVLEVGCGSGQATAGLLGCGWTVVAVDPGAELIALAKARLTSVEFHVGRFETFAPQPASFRLVASAQAWHWIDPSISFPKAAAALQPGGWLAIFGHVPLSPPPEICSCWSRSTPRSRRSSGGRRRRPGTCRKVRSARSSTPPACSDR